MLYNEGLAHGSARFQANTIKVALLTASYTPDADHNGYAAISPYELGTSGTNYTAGGNTLANKTSVVDDTNDLAYDGADDVEFSSLDNGSVRYAAVYDSTANILLRLIDFTTTRTLNGSDIFVRFANARIRETVAA